MLTQRLVGVSDRRCFVFLCTTSSWLPASVRLGVDLLGLLVEGKRLLMASCLVQCGADIV